MKLYQALKLKNKLAGELVQLQQTIQSKNSRVKGEETLFKLGEILLQLRQTRVKLIELKTAIHFANAPIQSKIFELAEMKSSVKFWNGVSTKTGKESDRWTKEIVEYESHFNEIQVLEFKKQLEKSISILQEDLDVFNHETEISFEYSEDIEGENLN